MGNELSDSGINPPYGLYPDLNAGVDSAEVLAQREHEEKQTPELVSGVAMKAAMHTDDSVAEQMLNGYGAKQGPRVDALPKVNDD